MNACHKKKMNLIEVMNRLQRGDKSTVLQLIEQNKQRMDSILEYCPSFQDDMDVVREAISVDPRNIRHASMELKNHFAIEVVRRMGRTLAYMSDEMRGNREVVLEAVRNDGMAILYSNLLDDEIMDAAIQQNPSAKSLIENMLDE